LVFGQIHGASVKTGTARGNNSICEAGRGVFSLGRSKERKLHENKMADGITSGGCPDSVQWLHLAGHRRRGGGGWWT
jgi:hypothetical protein